MSSPIRKLLKQVKSAFPDGDPQKILTALSKTHKDTRSLAINITAGRIWMHKVGMEVSRLSKIVDGTPDSPAALDQLGAALDHLFAVQAQLKGSSTSISRALEAHKIDPTKITDALTNKPSAEQGLWWTAILLSHFDSQRKAFRYPRHCSPFPRRDDSR